MKWKKNRKVLSLNRPKIRFLIIGFLFLILVFLFLKSNLFIIKSIDIDTQNISCATSDRIKKSSGLVGQNFFLIDREKIERNLKSKLFCIKNINIAKGLPNRLDIKVYERAAKAILALKPFEATIGGQLEKFIEASASATNITGPTEGYLVDDEGVLYSQQPADLPILYINEQKLVLGQKINDNLLKVLTIIDKIKIFGVQIKTVDVVNQVLIINYIPKIIFNLNRSLDNQIASLQLILEKAKIDSDKLEFIDLRFDKPIIRIAPKKN